MYLDVNVNVELKPRICVKYLKLNKKKSKNLIIT